MRRTIGILLLLVGVARADTITMVGGNITSNASTSVTNFMPAYGNADTSATESGIFLFPAPIAGTATAIYCTYGVQGTGPGAAGSYALTFRKNQAATALTCTITGLTTTDCNLTGQSVALVGGDLMSFSMAPSTVPTANTMSCSVAVTVTGAAVAPVVRPQPVLLDQLDLGPLRWFLQKGVS